MYIRHNFETLSVLKMPSCIRTRSSIPQHAGNTDSKISKQHGRQLVFGKQFAEKYLRIDLLYAGALPIHVFGRSVLTLQHSELKGTNGSEIFAINALKMSTNLPFRR